MIRSAPFLVQIIEGSRGRLDADSLGREMEAGRYWLAVAVRGDEVRAAMVLQPIRWPTGLNELVLMLAGDGLNEWGRFYPAIEDTAKALGFHVLCDAGGRRGFGRFLSKRGWTEAGVMFEKDLR